MRKPSFDGNLFRGGSRRQHHPARFDQHQFFDLGCGLEVVNGDLKTLLVEGRASEERRGCGYRPMIRKRCSLTFRWATE